MSTGTHHLATVNGEPFLSNEHQPELDTLIDFVLKQVSAPVDAYAIAAILESYGIRDIDALERYGKRDVFELAQSLFERCRAGLSQEFEHIKVTRTAPPAVDPRDVIERYLRRLSFSAPWALQMAFLLLRGYALGIYLNFTEYQATVVVLALMSSLMVSGGFMQALGRLLALYPPESHLGTARRIYIGTLGLSLVVLALVGAVLALIGMLIGQIPPYDTPLWLAYYLLFSASWLTLAGLYALRHVRYILLATFGGLLGVGLSFEVLHWPIYSAHWVGLGVASLIALSCGYRILWHEIRPNGQSEEAAPLSWRTLRAHFPMPYFVYGVLYFGFLFIDRLVGWSMRPPQLVVWFRVPYEIGLVLALIPLFLITPLLEQVAERSIWQMDAIQKHFSGLQIARHNRYFRRRYSEDVARLVVIFGMGAGVVFVGVQLAIEAKMLTDPVIAWVYAGASLGYGLLVVALANCLFLFTMARPTVVIRALAVACVVDLGVGLVFSRVNGYWYSILGLIAGALVFAIITGQAVLRGLKKIDYYGYAAY